MIVCFFLRILTDPNNQKAMSLSKEEVIEVIDVFIESLEDRAHIKVCASSPRQVRLLLKRTKKSGLASIPCRQKDSDEIIRHLKTSGITVCMPNLSEQPLIFLLYGSGDNQERSGFRQKPNRGISKPN